MIDIVSDSKQELEGARHRLIFLASTKQPDAHSDMLSWLMSAATVSLVRRRSKSIKRRRADFLSAATFAWQRPIGARRNRIAAR